jgi:chromosome segregation ATPase
MLMKRIASCFLPAIFLFPAAAISQSVVAPDSVSQQLLVEVRQLRLAIERATSVLPQAQLLLQRTQLQQQHVEAISRQLEQLRAELTRAWGEDAQMTAEIRTGEARATQESNQDRRRDLEDRIKALKAHLEQQGIRDQQQKAREGELAGQLQSEQIKLSELQQRLDALERTLQTPAPK